MAHASRYSKRLRYMGLRVKRNGPVVTRDDVAAGLVGFIVVFVRQNETMPEMPKTRPREARTSATATRGPNGISTGATREDASHMRKPKSSATAGGGTFSSSELMATKVGHNVTWLTKWLTLRAVCKAPFCSRCLSSFNPINPLRPRGS